MRYPTGVPTPNTMHVHPYPTRFHGGIWRRPVFGFPWVRRPFNIIRPSARAVPGGVPQTPPLIDARGQVVSGLGCMDADCIRQTGRPCPPGSRGVGDWDTATGVFRRPLLDGGGIFNEISGLGLSPDTQKFLGAAVVAGVVVAVLIAKKKKEHTPNKRRRR